MNNYIESNVTSFKDLGEWGKSIGNIQIYNTMFFEITKENWSPKMKKLIIKVIEKILAEEEDNV